MTKNVGTNYMQRFLRSQNIIPLICIKKWTEFFPSFNTADILIWHRIYKLYFSVIRETMLQTFQYLFIHRVISCNKWLCDKKIKSGSGCNFCNDVDDFFIYCEHTKQFWTSFYKWWNNISEFNIGRKDILKECTLFGYPSEEDIIQILNYCMLFAKYFIYTNKLNSNNTLDLYLYLVLLKRKIYIQKTICTQQNKPQLFEKWLFLYEGL